MGGFLLLLPTQLPAFRMPESSPAAGRRTAGGTVGEQELADNPA
jgi:hypothetical protein